MMPTSWSSLVRQNSQQVQRLDKIHSFQTLRAGLGRRPRRLLRDMGERAFDIDGICPPLSVCFALTVIYRVKLVIGDLDTVSAESVANTGTYMGFGFEMRESTFDDELILLPRR